MNGTFFFLDLLNTPAGFLVSGLIGLMFGFFLEQAGFGSSRKLTGVFYFKDMAVVKVMFTAVVVALVGYRYLTALGWLQAGDVYIMPTYWGAAIVGGIIFGIGFVMGGWCPGTAIVGLASAKLDALVFLVGAVLGGIFFNEIYAAVAPLYNGLCAGAVTLSDTLGLSMNILTLAVCAIAVLAFAGSTRLEARFGGAPPPDAATRRRRRWAAGALLVLAVGLFVMPSPTPVAATAAATAPPATFLDKVAAGEDHIDPAEAARRMMASEPGLLVVDIRPAPDFALFHLPGAVNVPLEQLPLRLSELGEAKTIILYSNGTTHAAQAWLALRHLGFSNVFVLTDGLVGFWRDCLTPPSLGEWPLDGQTAKALNAEYAKRKTYFIDQAPVAAAATSAEPKPDAAVAETVPAMPEPGVAKHLVSTEWLASVTNAPEIKIVDVRPKGTAFTTAHIPGAAYLSCESLRSTIDGIPAMVIPADEIAMQLGRIGVKRTDTVVLYSDNLRDATLVSMALARVGHPEYAVLHGGLNKWVAEQRPVTSDIPTPTAVTYKPVKGADTFTADIADVKAVLNDGKTVILDVRFADYFAGKKSDEARAGHIPGAVNREYTFDLVPGSELWQSTDRLKAAYEGLGITTHTPVIVHCRTGHQASQTYFLLKHLLGVKNVRWFDASWSAWAARKDLPVAQ